MITTAAAWLFTSGEASVRISVTPQPDGHYLLVVHGPGPAFATYRDRDVIACIRHQSAIEQEVVSRGFCLSRYTSERRVASVPWPEAERRRAALRLLPGTGTRSGGAGARNRRSSDARIPRRDWALLATLLASVVMLSGLSITGV